MPVAPRRNTLCLLLVFATCSATALADNTFASANAPPGETPPTGPAIELLKQRH